MWLLSGRQCRTDTVLLLMSAVYAVFLQTLSDSPWLALSDCNFPTFTVWLSLPGYPNLNVTVLRSLSNCQYLNLNVWLTPFVCHCMTDIAWMSLSDFCHCLTFFTAWLSSLSDFRHCRTFDSIWLSTLSDFRHCLTFITVWLSSLSDFRHRLTFLTVWMSLY